MAEEDTLPSLKALVAFEAAVRLGTLTAAAKALGTTQPAISQRIRGLEEAVGLALFERSVNGLEPTRDGLKLYDDIAPALGSIEASFHALKHKARSSCSSLVIAANFGFSHLWLLPRLPRLKQAFPQLDIEVLSVDHGDERHGRHSDIAIYFNEKRPGTDIFMPEAVLPVCSPGFAARHGLGPQSDPGKWLDLPLLHMDIRNPRWIDWRRWCEIVRMPYRERNTSFKYNNYPLLIHAAREGRGIALGWSALVESFIEQGQLVGLGPVAWRETHGYIVTTRYPSSALINQVIDWIKSEADAQVIEGDRAIDR